MKPFVKSAMKSAMALGVAGALMLTAATPSLARSRGWAAAGAGFVAGTILGAAVADANARYYNEPYGYAAPGPYYDAEPAYEPYGYSPSYRAPRYYTNTGPHGEDALTGTGIGASR